MINSTIYTKYTNNMRMLNNLWESTWSRLQIKQKRTRIKLTFWDGSEQMVGTPDKYIEEQGN